MASGGETREYPTMHRTVLTAMSYPGLNVNSAKIECLALDGPLCIQIWICRYLLSGADSGE